MQYDLFTPPKKNDIKYNGFKKLNEQQKSKTQETIQRAIDNSKLSYISVVRSDNGFKVLANNEFQIVDMFYYNPVMIRIISANHVIPCFTLWVYDLRHNQKLYQIITDNLNAIKEIIKNGIKV